MRAPANPPASKLGRLALSFVALMLATTLAGASAVADEPASDAADAVAASELGAAGADGAADAAFAGEGADVVPDGAPDDAHDAAQGALLAGQLSMELPLEAVVGGDVPSAQAGPSAPQTLAGYLAAGELRVSADVALAADEEDVEPVVGSFTVDGLTYAVTGEGEAALVAVSPRTLAGSLVGDAADGSVGAPSGEDSGSGVPTSPPPSPEGTSSDASEGVAGGAGTGPAGEPASLAIPATVEHDGVAYAVTSIGPRALAGCDADAVIVPATVASVDESAFQGSSVASVEVADGNPHYSSYDGMLFDADQHSLLLIPEGKQGAARIPKTAEVVDPSSFSHSAGVSAIDVEAGSAAYLSRNGCLYDASGETLLRVPAGATEVEIADGCTTVAAGSMEGCARLAIIQAPATVSSVSLLAMGEGGASGSVRIVLANDAAKSLWGAAGFDGGGVAPMASELGAAASARVEIGTKFTLTADYNGGTYVDGISTTYKYTVVYGGIAWCQMAAGKRAGYAIEGFYTQRTGGTKVWEYSQKVTDEQGGLPCVLQVKGSTYWDSNGNWRYPGDATAYARWTPIHVEWYFEPNGGAFSNGQTTTLWVDGGTYDPNKTLGDFWFQGAERSGGWAFAGWFTAASGGTQVTAATKIPTNVTTRYYAHWVRPEVWFFMDPNGGAFTNGQTTLLCSAHVTYDPALKLSAGNLQGSAVRAGYTFKGWFTAKTGGTQVTANSAFPYDYPTYYAQWSKVSYSIAYALNGGSITGQRTSYDIETANFNLAVPTRTGYSFAGWTVTGASGAGIATSGTTTTVKKGTYGNLTASAKWTANKYTVSFNANGGSGGQSANVTATYDSAMPGISTTKPTRTGYTFNGYWDTNAASGGTQYYNASCASARTWNKAGNATLYARWTANKYTVSFNANGGSGGQSAQVTATYDSAMPGISTTKPTRTGYAFEGYWDTSAASGGTQYYTAACASARNYNKASNTTLYARWTANRYTVSFNANGGSGGQSASVTATYDAAMPGISTTKPTKGGYAFAGWYDTSAASGGTQYYTAEGASARNWDKAGDATLHARWAALSYAVSYDAAGGSMPEGARSSYSTGDAFDLPVPTRYGYQFDGWDVAGAQGAGVEDVTAEDGSKATRVKAGTYGDLSCTARWTLRYDLDVPVADPGEVTFEADSLTGQVRVRPGTSAEGAILSYMAVPVALDSLSCEGLDSTGQPDAAGGAPELEAIFGAGSAAEVLFTATVGEGEAAATAKVTAAGATSSASLAGLSIPAAASHDAPGRVPVSYGLELDPGLAIPPVRDAAPVARLTWTVSLPAAGA